MAVDEAAGGAAGHGRGGKELAPEAGPLRAIGGGDEDIAGLEGIDGGDLLVVGMLRPPVDIGGEDGVGAADEPHRGSDGPQAGAHCLIEEPLAVEHVGDDAGVELRP